MRDRWGEANLQWMMIILWIVLLLWNGMASISPLLLVANCEPVFSSARWWIKIEREVVFERERDSEVSQRSSNTELDLVVNFFVSWQRWRRRLGYCAADGVSLQIFRPTHCCCCNEKSQNRKKSLEEKKTASRSLVSLSGARCCAAHRRSGYPPLLIVRKWNDWIFSKKKPEIFSLEIQSGKFPSTSEKNPGRSWNSRLLLRAAILAKQTRGVEKNKIHLCNIWKTHLELCFLIQQQQKKRI